MLKIRIARKIAELSVDEWNKVFPDVAESYYFFKSIDESEFEQFSFYYILVYREDSLVGATPCFLMQYSFDTTLEGFPKALARIIKKIFPKIFDARIIICGSPACEGRIGVVGDDKASVINAFVCAMQQIAKEEKASILAFKDITCDYALIVDNLLQNGFHKVEGYPAVEMDIDFKSFDEYLMKLSHVTRKGLRRKFRKVDKIVKLDLEVKNSLEESLNEAYGLYLQTLAKSEIKFEKIPKDFFINVSKNMPNETKYFLWRINKKLVAFELLFLKDATLVDEYVGFDYSVAYEYSLFYTTFRDIINWCIENGVKKYESGQLVYGPKKRLDFRFAPLYIYVKHTNKFKNSLLRILSDLLKPENFDEILRNMKKEGKL